MRQARHGAPTGFCGDNCRWKWRDDHRAPDLSNPERRAQKLAVAKERQWTRRCRRCGLPTWSEHSPYCLEHSREAALRRAARTRSPQQKPKTPEQILRARERERATRATRASPRERGYGADFKRERKRVERIVKAGLAVCARCGQPIRVVGGKPEPWDLGHNDFDRSLISGAEHRACNRATATHNARRRRGQRAVHQVEPTPGSRQERSTT